MGVFLWARYPCTGWERGDRPDSALLPQTLCELLHPVAHSLPHKLLHHPTRLQGVGRSRVFPDLTCKKNQTYEKCDESYYTNSSIILVKNMLCGELHCQRVFNLILFSNKIWSAWLHPPPHLLLPLSSLLIEAHKHTVLPIPEAVCLSRHRESRLY